MSDDLSEADLQEVRAEIERIREATDRLRAVGGDVPAIERNATRIRGTLSMLDAAVPPEVAEDD